MADTIKKQATETKKTAKLSETKVKVNDTKVDGEMLAVIRVRSNTKLALPIKDTLRMLGLNRTLSMAILPNKPNVLGMLRVAKDFITWGELSPEVRQEVIAKKGNDKVVFMHPPIGGFERKGIKVPYNLGGALGYRGKEINELVKRMLH